MPVVTSVSQATRPHGSSRSTSSRMASEIWSATLSGWPSVTDSEVNRCASVSLIITPLTQRALAGGPAVVQNLPDSPRAGMDWEEGTPVLAATNPTKTSPSWVGCGGTFQARTSPWKPSRGIDIDLGVKGGPRPVVEEPYSRRGKEEGPGRVPRRLALGPAVDEAVEEGRDGVQRRGADRLAAGLEVAGQRADHAAPLARAGHRERDLIAVEAMDQPLGQLDRAARAPRLADQAPHHRPVAHEVAHLAGDLDRMQPGLARDVEMVVVGERVLEVHGPLAGEADDLLVRDQHSERRLLDRLRHHRHRHRAVEAIVEIAQKAVPHPQQLVRRSAGGNGNLDPGLEPLPEILKIPDHDDREPPESDTQGYSPSPAK